MVKRIALVLVMVGAGFPRPAAFAAIQENGDPCPPECVTDTLVIDTWYPSPYNTYETLNSAKLAVGAYEDTEPSHIGEAENLKAWGQLKVGRGVIFKPVDPQNVDNSQINNFIAPAYAFTQGAEAGEMVYTTDDKFYHFNGSSWVPQGGSGGKAIINTFCPWRYDYREGVIPTVGFASNWGKQDDGSGNYPCNPPACPTGWENLGMIGSESLSVACPGYNDCHWGGVNYSTHPVSSGRVVRACREP